MLHPTESSAICQAAQRDHIAICHQLIGYEFPFEMNRALELALLRTFCVPSIARILNRTGKFIHQAQQRYDDTGLILGHLIKWGYDSPEGRAAIAQMNRIHRRYAIANEDFLYVLSVFIFEPIRWNARYGWRPFTDLEKLALFYFWCAVGDRMGIVHIPPTFAEFAAFNEAYEAQRFCYSPDNQAVGTATVRLMQSWVPGAIAPVVPRAVNALVDDRMREALGWPTPSRVLQSLLAAGLAGRRRLWRYLPRRRQPDFFVDRLPTPNWRSDIAYPEPPSPATASRCPFLRMRQALRSPS